MKEKKKWPHVCLCLAGLLLLFSCPIEACAKEEAAGQEDDSIYDILKDRMETAWERGMEQIEDVEPIEVTGNFMERILRSMADSLMVHQGRGAADRRSILCPRRDSGASGKEG